MLEETAAPLEGAAVFLLPIESAGQLTLWVHHAMLNEELLVWLQKALSQGDNAFFVRCKGVFIRKWRI